MNPPRGQKCLALAPTGGFSKRLTMPAGVFPGSCGRSFSLHPLYCNSNLFPGPAATSLGTCRNAEIVNFHGRVVQNPLLMFELKVSPYSRFKSIFFALDVASSVTFDSKMLPKSIHDRFDASKNLHLARNICFDAHKTRPRAAQKLPRLPQGAPKEVQKCRNRQFSWEGRSTSAFNV